MLTDGVMCVIGEVLLYAIVILAMLFSVALFVCSLSLKDEKHTDELWPGDW